MKLAKLTEKGWAEFTTSAMYLSMVCMRCVGKGLIPKPVNLSLNIGMALLAGVHCFLFDPSAHVSPCVSLAAFIVGEITWKTALMDMGCQLLGAFTGYGIVMCFLKNPSIHLVMNNKDMKVLLAEYWLIGAWVLCMTAFWSSQGRNKQAESMRIGLIVALVAIGGHYITGANLNPFCSLVFAVLSPKQELNWIEVMVSTFSALTFGFAWKFLCGAVRPRDRGFEHNY